MKQKKYKFACTVSGPPWHKDFLCVDKKQFGGCTLHEKISENVHGYLQFLYHTDRAEVAKKCEKISLEEMDIKIFYLKSYAK